MTSRSPVILELASRIRQMERCRSARSDEGSAPRGMEELQRVLPPAEQLKGRLIEWLCDRRGTGSVSLALWMTQSVIQRELMVVVDGHRQWYPPGLLSVVKDLRQVVFVQPPNGLDALWSVEQALRTRGVGAVVCEVERLSPAVFRRLQLAAETGGTIGILLRPDSARQQPSWADYRLGVRPLADSQGARDAVTSKRRVLIELLRAKNIFTEGSVILELDDAANGRLCVAPELVAATSLTRATGA